MNHVKALLLATLTVGVFCVQVTYDRVSQAQVESTLAFEQLSNPSFAASSASRNHAAFTDATFGVCYLLILALGLVLYRRSLLNLVSPQAAKASALLLVAGLAVGSSGCRKPYHEKLYVDVGTSEIAILVETINDEKQATVASEDKGGVVDADGNQVDYYAKRVVNAKRVEIPYYWKQTSRVYLREHSGNGKWTPAARLLAINTAPEVREWKDGQQAIWAESKDSVGFSTGISVTARIQDRKAALNFLSNYPPKASRQVVTEGGEPFNVEVTSLQQIMDTEVRTKIQEVFAYAAAAYNMDELREKKREILDEIRDIVVPYFNDRGITITSIGQFGGFKYENNKIQESIDAVFQAQQDEEVAKAEAKAAEQRKVALRLIGEGEADKEIERANGEAEAIKLVADAKAYELQKLQENPEAYIQLKNLEVEMERLKQWDGKYPQTLFGGAGGNPAVPLLNLKVQ